MLRYGLLTILMLTSTAFGATPDRFLNVAPGIYRSAQPEGDDYLTLRDDHGIRTIVSINDDEETIAREQLAADAAGIRFISIPLNGFLAPSHEDIDNILRTLDDESLHPVLVHCQYGRDRTGLVTGLYRVLYQDWAPKAAWKEMLDRGFRRVLFPLEYYFRDRTGYWKLPSPAAAAMARQEALAQ